MKPIVNEALCFVCQDCEPTNTVTRRQEQFKVCDQCAAVINHEVRLQNAIKRAIYSGQCGKIFQMTLGASLTPVEIKITKGV
jgi:hypothetical protein